MIEKRNVSRSGSAENTWRQIAPTTQASSKGRINTADAYRGPFNSKPNTAHNSSRPSPRPQHRKIKSR